MSFFTGQAKPQFGKEPPFTVPFQPFSEKYTDGGNSSAYQSISFMSAYQHRSFEEIRVNDYAWGRLGPGFFTKNSKMANNNTPSKGSSKRPFGSGDTFNNFDPADFSAASSGSGNASSSGFGADKLPTPGFFGGSPGMFGTTLSSSDATKSPFGSSANVESGLFGAATSGIDAPESPFGSSGNSKPTLFGTSPSSNDANKSPFGTTANAKPGLFGTASPGKNAVRPQGSSLSLPKTGVFGAASPQTNATHPQSKPSLFGAAPASTGGAKTTSHTFGQVKPGNFGASEFGDFVKSSTSVSTPAVDAVASNALISTNGGDANSNAIIGSNTRYAAANGPVSFASRPFGRRLMATARK